MNHYIIDPTHSSVSFSIAHLMIAKVRGSFSEFSGELHYDTNNLQSTRASASIQVASINTHQTQRDEHLKSVDFFDAANFPSIQFTSTQVQKSETGLKVIGHLTIKSVQKEIVLDVEGPSPEIKDPFGNTKIGLSAQATLNRKDFGLNWNAALETGGLLVGEEVKIILDLEFSKQA